jgi:phytoene dehydrogenase-like protein
MMPYTELEHGVWYPKGGMFSIVEALMLLAHQVGVEFAFDTTVEGIRVNRSRATGLELEHNQHIMPDIILANADLPYIYDNLLPKDSVAERISRMQFSCSVISFFWGVDKPYPALGPHTLFLADDYRENFTSIIQDLDLPTNPSLYVHAPARLDASMAPPGEDTITAILPVGHLSSPSLACKRNKLAMLGITS